MLLAQEHCPNCGRRRPRRSHDPVLHYLRTFRGRSHRYCPSCRIHWHSSHIPVPPARILDTGNRIEVLVLLAAFLASVLASEVRFHPYRWTQNKVVTRYEKKYGAGAKAKLWDHFGWIYSNKEAAREDYRKMIRR